MHISCGRTAAQHKPIEHAQFRTCYRTASVSSMLIRDFFQRIMPKDNGIFVPILFNAEDEAANDVVGDEAKDLLALRTNEERRQASTHTVRK